MLWKRRMRLGRLSYIEHAIFLFLNRLISILRYSNKSMRDKNKDIAAIRKLFQMHAGVEATDEQMKEGIEFLASAAPKNLKITKGYINTSRDRAVVYLTGTEEAEKLYGTIGLIKKNEAWVVTEEHWSNAPLKK